MDHPDAKENLKKKKKTSASFSSLEDILSEASKEKVDSLMKVSDF
jgi:hypothetical protein